MARTGTSYLNKLADQNAMRRWSRTARAADDMPLETLKAIQGRAKNLRKHVTRVIATAEERLTRPKSNVSSLKEMLNADWAWRPDIWRGRADMRGAASVGSGDYFGGSIKVFHDCPLSENALRQVPNTGQADLAPFGLRMDVMGFEGSFMSLVVDIPDDGLAGLTRQNLIRLMVDVDAESPAPAYARLNIKNGPNTAQMVQNMSEGSGNEAEFDLGYLDFNEAQVENAWVELIFNDVRFNQVIVRDFVLCRRQRAEL